MGFDSRDYRVWALIAATAGIVGINAAKAGLILPDELLCSLNGLGCQGVAGSCL